MKKLVITVVGAAALATMGMAVAGGMTTEQGASGSNAAGIYVSGNVGYGWIDAKKQAGVTYTKFDNSGFAWSTDAGYQFNDYVALEVGYINFGEVKQNTANATGSTSFSGIDAAVKGIWPINDQFNVFGKAGVIHMHAHSAFTGNAVERDNSWAPLLALGGSYNVNNNVALTLQDDYAFKSHFHRAGAKLTMNSANALLAGVSYKFNV